MDDASGYRNGSLRETHRTIFCFDTPFLDAANFAPAEEAFERFRQTVPRGGRIAVDFGLVEYLTESWPVLPGSPGSSVQRHFVVCMRLHARVKEALAFLGLSTLPGYEYICEGVCPACGCAFDHAQSTCSACGRFEVETFTWRPRG